MITSNRVLIFPFLVVKIFYYIGLSILRTILPFDFLPKKSLKNENVLITGSAGGLGREMAVLFAREGANLILWDINANENEITKLMVEEAGSNACCYTVNLSDRSQIYNTAELVLKRFDHIDVLVNNAGIVTGKKLFDCPDDLMERTMSVNTNALFYLSKAFIPQMLERDHGHVVTIASMAGLVGIAGLVDYCSSKFGAVGFAESLRAELRSKSSNVQVSLVCPYYINTGMFDGVKAASPLFLPMMEPNYVARKVVEAIQRNTVVLYLPRFCNFVMFIKSILPTVAAEAIADYFGVHREMDTFVGHKIVNKHVNKPIESTELKTLFGEHNISRTFATDMPMKTTETQEELVSTEVHQINVQTNTASHESSPSLDDSDTPPHLNDLRALASKEFRNNKNSRNFRYKNKTNKQTV